jgi:hypothetical protein
MAKKDTVRFVYVVKNPASVPAAVVEKVRGLAAKFSPKPFKPYWALEQADGTKASFYDVCSALGVNGDHVKNLTSRNGYVTLHLTEEKPVEKPRLVKPVATGESLRKLYTR